MLLSLLIAGLLGVLAYVLRPRISPRGTSPEPLTTPRVTAPLRLGIVRAAIVLGAYSIGVIELASITESLHPTAIRAAWLAAAIIIGALFIWRLRYDQRHQGDSSLWPGDAARQRTRIPLPHHFGWHWWVTGLVGLLLAGALTLALFSAPGNFDSQTYHLPRIEHWVQQGSVEPFATAIHRQVDIAPGAEYLLTHLRLASGGDGAYNLLQFAAGLGTLLAASRITSQLGGGRSAQIICVAVLATTPEILLQASSTQVDLVTAAWVACLATVSLDARTRDLAYLGLATGLVAVTKSSGLLAVAFLLLMWGMRRLAADYRAGKTRRDRGRAYGTTVATSVSVLIIAIAVAGPFMGRMWEHFGHPLGPEQLYDSIAVQSHDPRYVIVNSLRITHTAIDTPIQPLSDASAQAIVVIADLLGVDPNDEDITFGSTTWPVESWYPDEDRAAMPLTGLAAIAATLAFLLWPNTGGLTQLRRAWAVILILTALSFASVVQWQPWINRLYLFLVVLAAPLIGILASLILRRLLRLKFGWRRTTAMTGVISIAATAALAGVLTVTYGYPRRLVGEGSIVTTTEAEQRFMRRDHWREQYQQAADAVTEREPERVGLVQSNDSWEYPWWLYLPEGAEIVPLQSTLPGLAPGNAEEVEAIVCAEDLDACVEIAPEDWKVVLFTDVGYALPPQRELSFSYVAFRPRYPHLN